MVDSVSSVTVKYVSDGADRLAADFARVEAAERKLAAQGQATAIVNETRNKGYLDAERRVDSYIRKLDPVARALADVHRGETLVNTARAQGLGNLSAAERGLALAKQRHDELSKAANDNAAAIHNHSDALGLNRMQMMESAHVARALFDEMAAGANPIRALAMESGRIGQILASGNGGIGGVVKGIASKVSEVITPARLAGGLVAAIAVTGYAAWSAWDDKIKSLTLSLNGLGRASGMSVSSLQTMALTQGRSLGAGQALSSAASYAGAGIDGNVIGGLLGSQQKFGRAFGLSGSDATAELTKAFADPAKGAEELAKRFGPLGYEVDQQVKGLQAVGRLEEARAVLFRSFTVELNKTKDASGYLAHAMESTASIVSTAWAKLGKIGAELSPQEKLAAALKSFQAETPGDSVSRRGSLSGFAFGGDQPSVSSAKAAAVVEAGKAVLSETLTAWGTAFDVATKRWSYLQAEINKVNDESRLGAAGILARTAAERLAVEQDRIHTTALHDTTKRLTEAAEAEKARNLAVAESTKLLRDNARDLADRHGTAGMTDYEKMLHEMDIKYRNLGDGMVGGKGNSNIGVAAAGGSPMAILQSHLGEGAGAIQGFLSQGGQSLNASLNAWCAAALNSALEQAGIHGSGSDAARSLLKVGTAVSAPQRGDIAVMSRGAPGSGLGHAGFFDKFNEDGTVRVLGGNTGGKVGYGNYDPSRVLGYRRVDGAEGGPMPPLTVRNSGGNIASQMALDKADRTLEMWVPALDKAEKAIDANNAMLDVQRETFGKSTAEIASANEAQRLKNDLEAKGLDLESSVLAKANERIALLAKEAGVYAANKESVDKAQRKAVETSDFIRSTANDLISSPLLALAHHQNPMEALKAAGARLGDNLINQGTKSLTTSLFGEMGTSMFGGGKDMEVSAGTVNINQGVLGGLLGGGGGGAGGGIGGLIGKIFGFGGGGGASGTGSGVIGGSPMQLSGAVGQNAEGTDNWRGGPTWVGEKGPEIVNLPRGAQVVPNGKTGGGNVVHIGGPTLTVQGNVTEDVLPKVQAMIAQSARDQQRQIQRNFATIGRTNQARFGQG